MPRSQKLPIRSENAFTLFQQDARLALGAGFDPRPGVIE
jgi:hypothetical protein